MSAHPQRPNAEEWAELAELLSPWRQFEIALIALWKMTLHTLREPTGQNAKATAGIAGAIIAYAWPVGWRVGVWVVFALLAGVTVVQSVR